MKILINTNYSSAGTKVCVDDLSVKLKNAGIEVIRNDWDNYQNYDVVLFMAPDSEVRKVKKINPSAFVGIMIPTITKERLKEIKAADFLLVGSIEHREALLKYNKNIFIYYMFPEVKSMFKEHSKKDKVIIGYHGNKKHLEQMKDVIWALDKLTEKYNIEFWPIYNIEKRGRWEKNLPKKCPVKHIQWSEDNYYKHLSQADIGIMPSKDPIKYLFKGFGLDRYSYFIKFKYTANPGRAYIFSQLSIPIVADFIPSVCQIIEDGKSGFLVWYKEGWYYALEKLINSPELRNTMSQNLKTYIDNNCSPDINFKEFLTFINHE